MCHKDQSGLTADDYARAEERERRALDCPCLIVSGNEFRLVGTGLLLTDGRYGLVKRDPVGDERTLEKKKRPAPLETGEPG